jgi:transposase
MVWAGIFLDGHSDLHIFEGGTLTRSRYRDEILEHYVRPHASEVGENFLFMDDNARPHRARLVDQYLQEHGIARMNWPARSPDLNPIEHVWDALGRRVSSRQPPPRTLNELKIALIQEWSLLPVELINVLIDSMPRRCQTCLSVRGDHTPY